MTLKFEFKVVCITEIWCSDNSMNHNLFKLPRYKSIHQVRKTCEGGGIAVFLHESLTFNIRYDLSVNNADIEAPCVELLIKSQKTSLITLSIINQQEISINLSHISTDFLLDLKLLIKHAF